MLNVIELINCYKYNQIFYTDAMLESNTRKAAEATGSLEKVNKIQLYLCLFTN